MHYRRCWVFRRNFDAISDGTLCVYSSWSEAILYNWCQWKFLCGNQRCHASRRSVADTTANLSRQHFRKFLRWRVVVTQCLAIRDVMCNVMHVHDEVKQRGATKVTARLQDTMIRHQATIAIPATYGDVNDREIPHGKLRPIIDPLRTFWSRCVFNWKSSWYFGGCIAFYVEISLVLLISSLFSR